MLLKAYRCADKVICLSTYGELYYRMLGVNAEYIPNPVHTYNIITNKNRFNIAIIGRFSDHIKQIGDAIKILSELKRKINDFHAIFIGDFSKYKHRDQFFKQVKEFGLDEQITLTGWLPDIKKALADCGIILSTSRSEGFPMGIMEGQAMGLPCVAYELPIMAARNNPAIIMVRQGDVRAAAKELSRLLADSGFWQELSQIAIEQAQRFTPGRFSNALCDLVETLGIKSELHKYTAPEYQMVVKVLRENIQATKAKKDY